MNRFYRGVDTVNEWTGRSACYLLLLLTLVVFTEVILRYIFNNPTIWSWDVAMQLAGAAALLGMGYLLLHDKHVAVDVLVNRLPIRRRRILKIAVSPIFFFGVIVLVWQSSVSAWESLIKGEVTNTILAMPVYPFKIVMAFAAVMLLLQGVVNFTRDLRLVTEANGENIE